MNKFILICFIAAAISTLTAGDDTAALFIKNVDKQNVGARLNEMESLAVENCLANIKISFPDNENPTLESLIVMLNKQLSAEKCNMQIKIHITGSEEWWETARKLTLTETQAFKLGNYKTASQFVATLDGFNLLQVISTSWGTPAFGYFKDIIILSPSVAFGWH